MKPQQMTKVEKAALDIACARISGSQGTKVFHPGDAGDIERMMFAESCRYIAERLMDPEPAEKNMNPEHVFLCHEQGHADQILADAKEIIIWTDGSCNPNPGHGGWGFYVQIDGEGFGNHCGYGGPDTTNNRMELKAAIEALKIIPPRVNFDLRTDSQYVRQGITSWCAKWIRQDWKTSNKKPVKNKDLWIELVELNQNRLVNWVWVRGHNGDYGNEVADTLAEKGRKMGYRLPDPQS